VRAERDRQRSAELPMPTPAPMAAPVVVSVDGMAPIEVAIAPLPPGRRYADQNEKDPVRRSYLEGRDMVSDRDWDKASARFNELLTKYPKDKIVDEILYWYGFSLKKQGKYEDSWRALERLSSEFPRSRWVRDAKALQIEIAPILGKAAPENADADCELKVFALQSLASSNPERALAAIEKMLKQPDSSCPEMQRGAVLILGQIGDARSRALALELVRTAQDTEVQKAAIWALGMSIENADAIDDATFNALTSLATTASDEDVARTALLALAQREDPRVCSFLTATATGTAAPEVRRMAILMLGERASCATVDALEKICAAAPDDDPRRMALIALAERNDAQSLDALVRVARSAQSTEIRRFALIQFAERDAGRAVQLLSEWYDAERNETLKEQMIDSLGQIEDRRALEKLLKIARADQLPAMRKRAIMWIGQSDDPEATKLLEEILK
jgi:HEAT repeat protein